MMAFAVITKSNRPALRGGISAYRLQRSDAWLGKLYRAIRKIMDGWVREVARRVREGLEPVPVDADDRWTAQLVEAQWPYMLTMATDGWELAAIETGQKSFDDYREWVGRGMPLVGKKIKGEPIQVIRGEGQGLALSPIDMPVRNWLETVASETTRRRARDIDGIHRDARAHWDPNKMRGLTNRDIAKAILDGGLAKNQYHAAMIARTNTLWSFNEGAMRRYENDGVTVKEWFTTEDDKLCPLCRKLDGKRVRIQDNFLEKGVRFGVEDDEGNVRTMKTSKDWGVSHPPLHPHCRCTLLPVFAESLALIDGAVPDSEPRDNLVSMVVDAAVEASAAIKPPKPKPAPTLEAKPVQESASGTTSASTP